MPDDLTNPGPQDRSRISLLEPQEVQYWADKFNVSKERVRSGEERRTLRSRSRKRTEKIGLGTTPLGRPNGAARSERKKKSGTTTDVAASLLRLWW